MGNCKIEFNYDDTMKYIAELEGLAVQLEKELINNTEASMSELHSNWQGENANEYYSKLNLFKENSRAYVKNIRRIIEAVRENANDLHKAELESIDIVRG